MELILAIGISCGFAGGIFLLLSFATGEFIFPVILIALIMIGIMFPCISLYKKKRKEAMIKKAAKVQEKKKEEERWNNLTQEEKDKELSSQIPTDNAYCPGCRRTLAYYKNGNYISQWLEKGVDHKTETVFDSMHSVGGFGTVNFKEKQKRVYHYACPHCGYTKSKEISF